MSLIIKLVATAIMTAALLQGCATIQANKTPDALFAEGERLYLKGNYQEAIEQWKKVKESYHSPELSARAEIGIADAYFMNRDYIESAAAYEDFRKLHPRHQKADHALHRQGLSYYNQITGIDTDQTPVKNALSIFESYQKHYPAGERIGEVRTKINECRDKELQHEIYVGRFYLKTGVYKSAIGRFEEAMKLFQNQARLDEVLYCLGKAYLKDGQKLKADETFGQLSREYPKSPFINEAR